MKGQPREQEEADVASEAAYRCRRGGLATGPVDELGPRAIEGSIMMTFHCPCGFSYEGNGPMTSLDHKPEPGTCCNCGGQKCMGCVFREYDHQCADDCPDCCKVSVFGSAIGETT